MNRIIKRLAVPLSAAAVLGTAGFAYMASNNVDASQAGSGYGQVTGYNVHNISYTAPFGGAITAVSFTLDGPAKASNMKATVYSVTPPATQHAGYAYTVCTNSGTALPSGDYPAGSTWTCTTGSHPAVATEAGADLLAVNAAQ